MTARTSIKTTLLPAFASGALFGTGLWVSGMTIPAKVLGFLDLFGAWDPSLGLVMAAALAVTVPGFAWARRRAGPLFAARFSWPTKRDVDARLASGAALFGIGWGLAGLCPGPAIAILPVSPGAGLVFFAGMVLGMTVLALIDRPGLAEGAGQAGR